MGVVRRLADRRVSLRHRSRMAAAWTALEAWSVSSAKTHHDELGTTVRLWLASWHSIWSIWCAANDYFFSLIFGTCRACMEELMNQPADAGYVENITAPPAHNKDMEARQFGSLRFF